jgi:hypothetical protein
MAMSFDFAAHCQQKTARGTDSDLMKATRAASLTK